MLTIAKTTYDLDATAYWTRLNESGKSRVQVSAREHVLIDAYEKLSRGIEHFKISPNFWIQRAFLCARHGFNVIQHGRYFNHCTNRWSVLPDVLPDGVALQHDDVCNAVCFPTFNDAYVAALGAPSF